LRCVGAVMEVPSGVDPAGVLVVAPDPPAGANRQVFYRDLSSRLASVSGVASASLSWVPPISDDLGSWTQTIGVDGAPPSTEVAHNAPDAVFFNAVSPGYFETVGTRLLAGRGFAWRDRNGSPRVVVVNESLARRAFGNQNPIGHRITIGLDPARRDLEIVGLVQDAKYQRLQEAMQAIAYLPYEQVPEFVAGNNLVAEVRTIGRPAAAIDAVRYAVRALTPPSPIEVRTLSSRIDDSLVRERLIAIIAVVLAVFALVLSCAALYGLMAHMVARRTNEIGIRLALGASERAILGLVAGDVTRLAAVGTLAGVAFVAASRRLAERFLFGITVLDATALATAALIVVATAFLAGCLPARRAMRLDPTVALRSNE